MNTVAHLVPSASDRENASAGAEGNAVCGQPGANRRLLSMPNGLCQETLPPAPHLQVGLQRVPAHVYKGAAKTRLSYLRL